MDTQSTDSTLPELSEFVTVDEFKLLEKANIAAALAHANWKVWGPGGAAELLGMSPSTLSYQMNALGIVKQNSKDQVTAIRRLID